MFNKLMLLNHVILNNPGRETLTAGLGPAEQYFVALVALIIIVLVVYFRKKKAS